MSPSPDSRTPAPPTKLVGVALLITLITSVLLYLFTWPAHNSTPRNLPVALVAPQPTAQTVVDRLESANPGAIDVRYFLDETKARHAVLEREVYGALIMEENGLRVLTASAASPMVAQMLEQMASAMMPSAQQAPKPLVDDLVPVTEADPRQVGFVALGIPLIVGGVLPIIMVNSFFARTRDRFYGTILAVLGTGFAVTAILQFGFGTLAGSYVLNSLVTTLGIGAISLFGLGLSTLFGAIGYYLAALTMMLIGNPLSSLGGAPEMLPSALGAVGQHLPRARSAP